MSHVVSGIAQQKRVGSATRKAILMHMAAIASDDGSGVWTSKGNMANDLEMGRRTVQENINALVEMGVISVVGQRTCRNGFTVEYRVNMGALEALESTRAGAAPVREPHMTCAPAAQVPVREPHTNLPLTIHEPSKVCNSARERNDRFDEFWHRYPRKVGKGHAQKAYAKAIKKVDHDELIYALSQQIPAMESKEPQYRPHPATWLNSERWNDEPEQPTSTYNGSRPGGSGNAMVDAFAAVAAERSARNGRG